LVGKILVIFHFITIIAKKEKSNKQTNKEKEKIQK